MPGRAEKESGIITPKLDAPERRAPPGPLQPPCRTPLSATPQGQEQSHPVTARASSAFHLPIALERAAAADISIRAKSPCKQLWSEPLGACNISLGPPRVFSVLFAGWRASTLCARVLDAAGHHAPPSSQAAGAPCPHSSGRRRAAGTGSTRETHVVGAGRASATDANQPGHVHAAQAWEKSSAPVARSH